MNTNQLVKALHRQSRTVEFHSPIDWNAGPSIVPFFQQMLSPQVGFTTFVVRRTSL